MYNPEVDNQFQQLQSAMERTESQLGQMVQQIRAANSPEAKELEFSLRELALSMQQERGMLSNLLSAIHMQFSQQQPQGYQGQGYQNQGQQNYGQGGFGGGGGFMQTIEHAVEMGAGFGIGDDLINKIF